MMPGLDLRIGLVVVAGALAGACFNPEDPAPIDTETGSSGGTTDVDDTTSTGPGATTIDPDDSSTGPGGSPCDPSPCMNEGECIAVAGGFTCNCPAGFEGELCETAVDPCEPNPCENGGTCGVAAGEVVCECAPGFEGEVCETEIDECAAMPCQNGGTCTDEVAGFSCECPPVFEGETCEINVDDCAGDPCQNGGTCIDGLGDFTCECAEGFFGPLCQCQQLPPTQVDYTNDGTFTSAVLYDDPPGVQVTGSNTINVLNLNGLGIVGGNNSNTVDGAEWIELTFDHPSTSTQYFVTSAGNIDGDGFVGEAVVQAFDAAGMSLGMANVNGSGLQNLDALFPGVMEISRFRVTAMVDSFRLGSVTVSPLVCN